MPHPQIDRSGGRLALLVIAAAQLMLTLDATIVNIALPAIDRSLHFSPSALEWLVTAYSLTFGGLLIFGGRAGDLFGKRRLFLIGIGIFTLASLADGLAQSETWLIVGRGIQGVGAALASPAALSLIATTFHEGEARNRAMGIYATVSVAGAAVGLILGGVFTDLLSWRWIFLVNVPVGVLVAIIARRVLRESAVARGRLDLGGATTLTAGTLALVYGLANAADHPWGSAWTLVPLIVAVVLLLGFGVLESRVSDPLVPLSIFADRNRSGAYAIMFCVYAASFGFYYFLTLFVQNILGYSPLAAGIALLPIALAIGGAAVAVSRLIARIGIRLPLILGPAFVAIGLAWLSLLTPTSSYVDILGPILVVSVGLGLTFVPVTITVVSGVHPDQTGLASALLNTSQQLGGAVGLAVLATIAITVTDATSATSARAHRGGVAQALALDALTAGYSMAFLISAGVALVGVVVALVVVRGNAVFQRR